MSDMTLNGPSPLLYVHGPKWEYRTDEDDPHTASYIPARVLTLLRPDRDLIVVPGKNIYIREFANFCVQVLGLRSWQILFTSGKSYQVQTDAGKELVKELRAHMAKAEWLLVPYAASDSMYKLASLLDTKVLGDNPRWVKKFGTKGVLHPNAIPELRPRGLPLITEEVLDILVPRGYLATSSKELMVAHRLLEKEGVLVMILKPIIGSTGQGITLINGRGDIEGYSFPLGPVVLEERLQIDTNLAGDPISPALQYLRGLVSSPSDQIMRGLSHSGNRFPSCVSGTFRERFEGLATRVLAWTNPSGPGGFDVLSVQGKPVLVDINSGRWTGAHPPFLFRSMYAAGSHFISWKIMPRESIWEFWSRLRERGLALLPGVTKRGVFPLCYLPGMWGMLAAFGDSSEEAAYLAKEVDGLW